MKTAEQELLELLPTLVQEAEEMVPLQEDAVRDRAKRDWFGQNTRALAGEYRLLGIAYYKLNGDVVAFRSYLNRSVELAQTLFDRRTAGERIDLSYLSLLRYQNLFDALAIGQWEMATRMARSLGYLGEHEKKQVHPFDYAFGYTIKCFVLNDREQMSNWTPRFSEACKQTKMQDFLGYADVFDAILRNDSVAAQRGFESILIGHQRQCEGRGLFALRDDRLLCVWGIGMANLCRHRGLQVSGIPPLIPDELLI